MESEPTLYQKTDDHMHWTDSSDKCKHPGCDAVLMYGVPVEPDYEASAIRYRKMYPGYDPTLIGEVIKPVVDAAYGIGDKHE